MHRCVGNAIPYFLFLSRGASPFMISSSLTPRYAYTQAGRVAGIIGVSHTVRMAGVHSCVRAGREPMHEDKQSTREALVVDGPNA